MPWIIGLPLERSARSVSNLAQVLGMISSGAENNIAELVAQGMAEICPKLIRFPDVAAALR